MNETPIPPVDPAPDLPGPAGGGLPGASGLDAAAIGARVRAARRQGKGKRKRVSRPFRDLVEADRQLSRAAHRLARAAEKGLAAYRDGQESSSEAKRDGAVRDQPLNAAEGLAVALGEASRVPVDLARAMTTRSGRRLVRRTARLLLSPLGR